MTKRCLKKSKAILESINKNIYWIEGKEEIYSKKGNIKCRLNKAGYYYFNLYYNKKRYVVLKHHFIWYFYKKTIPKGVIDHIDSNKINNSIKNLQDISIKENTMKSINCYINLQIIKELEDLHLKGVEPLEICKKYNISSSHYRIIRNNNFKDKSKFKSGPKGLGKENVILIKKMLNENYSIKKIAAKFNCHRGAIAKIKSGERWANI